MNQWILTAIMIGCLSAGLFLGYQFCMVRNLVKETQDLLKIINRLLKGDAPAAQILEELEKWRDKHERFQEE